MNSASSYFPIKENSKILILLPRQLGDIILGTPLVSAMKKEWPQIQIDWWTHPMGEQILCGNPLIRKVFSYPIWNKDVTKKIPFWKTILLRFRFFWDSIYFVFQIRKERHDVVIDVINYPRSALQTAILSAPIKISFKTNSIRDFVYTHTIPRSELDDSYIGHARLKLLSHLGLSFQKKDLQQIDPLLPVSDTDKIFIHKWLDTVKLSSANGFCLISPTQRNVVKRWSPEKFLDLAFLMIIKHSVQIIWLRGPGEDNFVRPIHDGLQKRLKEDFVQEEFSLFPPLFSLAQSAVLASLAHVWIGCSNGMSHVAVAAGGKTVEIFGPSSPVSWCHPDKKKHRFLFRTEGCHGCSNNICKLPRRECLDDLTVQNVYKEVEELCFHES